jgi:hypothetical protein
MLLFMDALVAFCVVQESVAVSPGAIEDFEMASVQTGAGFVVVIVTVAVHGELFVPSAAVAMPVYVTVFVTVTDSLPAATGVTEVPSIANVAAFFVVHVSVTGPLAVSDVWDAASVQTGAEGGGGVVTVTDAGHVTVPPAPVAVSV